MIEEVIEPELVKTAPEQWRCIGQEVSEQLDYRTGAFLTAADHPQEVYVHRTEVDAVPVIAPLPERLLDRSLPAPGLLATHLGQQVLRSPAAVSAGTDLRPTPSSSLVSSNVMRWVALAADWLQPIYEQIRTGVMAGGYVQLDETPIDYLEPGNGKTKQGASLDGSRPGGDVFFHWETSRATACLKTSFPPPSRAPSM